MLIYILSLKRSYFPVIFPDSNSSSFFTQFGPQSGILDKCTQFIDEIVQVPRLCKQPTLTHELPDFRVIVRYDRPACARILE